MNRRAVLAFGLGGMLSAILLSFLEIDHFWVMLFFAFCCVASVADTSRTWSPDEEGEQSSASVGEDDGQPDGNGSWRVRLSFLPLLVASFLWLAFCALRVVRSDYAHWWGVLLALALFGYLFVVSAVRVFRRVPPRAAAFRFFCRKHVESDLPAVAVGLGVMLGVLVISLWFAGKW